MEFERSTSCDSLEGITESYYNVLKRIFYDAAKKKCEGEVFDGELRGEEFEKKAKFVLQTHITPFSQALIEYLVVLEWKVQNKVPAISKMAIYNSILRLEKALMKMSFWELFESETGKEENNYYAGPLSYLSTFEMNMIEQTSSIYIVNMFEEFRGTLFFPLKSTPEADALITWRILEKIAAVKVIPSKTIYQQKLRLCLEKRLQTEIQEWLKGKLKQLKINNQRTILNDVKTLTTSLKEINEDMVAFVKDKHFVNSLFVAANSCYFGVIAEMIDKELWESCNKVMEFLNTYNELHKEFHVNLRESSMLCLAFYLQMKKMYETFASQTKTFPASKLIDLEKMFETSFLHLLRVITDESHARVRRAMESNDKESIIDEGVWSSIVIVQSCFCTVLDEWKQFKIGNENMKSKFLWKITEVICNGCKICCESLLADCKDSSDSTDLKTLKVMCIHANTVQYIIDYMHTLPDKMQWNKRLSSLRGTDTRNETKTKVQSFFSLRSLSQILESSSSDLSSIKENIFEIIATYVRKPCNKFLNSWLKDSLIRDPRLQSVEKLLVVLNDSLMVLWENLISELGPSLIHTIWKNILTYVNSEFQHGRAPEYSKTIKKNIEEIHKNLIKFELKDSEETTNFYKEILDTLEVNSKRTLELQLEYFGQIADEYESLEVDLGKMAFQIGHKASAKKTIDITIKIHKAKTLPVQNYNILSLKARVDFCPHFLFPALKKIETKLVTEELCNPVFDETFSL